MHGSSDHSFLLYKQLEEGQVKMQSRLEEEEEAKAALMSRIQRLTKLILVSSKNSVPGCLTDLPGHQCRQSLGEDDVSFFKLKIETRASRDHYFFLS